MHKPFDIISPAIITDQEELDNQQLVQEISIFLYNKIRRCDIRFEQSLVIETNRWQYIQLRGIATDDKCRVWLMNQRGNWMLFNQKNCGGELHYIGSILLLKLQALYGAKR